MIKELNGTWDVSLEDGSKGVMQLPGTLDESGIGSSDQGNNQWHPDMHLGEALQAGDLNATIATRFTRRCTYMGEARISRRIAIDFYENKRIFIKAERARVLKVLADGAECPDFVKGTLSTPYIFELTGMKEGMHDLTFLSDNTYPNMPRGAICDSSAATDETQTNWNGILGELVMYTKPQTFIKRLRVYPIRKAGATRGFELNVCVEIAGADQDLFPESAKLILHSDALKKEASIELSGQESVFPQVGEEREDNWTETWIRGLSLKDKLELWDEGSGNLYEMQALLCDMDDRVLDECRVRFGIRSFGDNGAGRLALNERTIFLRSETNCAVYPETGHPPMTIEEWKVILRQYMAYGVNCVRFHSHCEPEAAFAAADELGMMLQPELSNWNPKDAFESDESYDYYRRELREVIKEYANHPSFVMLTLGNELHANETGKRRMSDLIKLARELDPTRFYASGSNNFYGNEGCDSDSDFYTSQNCRGAQIRGTFSGMRGYINEKYPSAAHDYTDAVMKIREEYKKPVFSFEVGQYEVLPDFDELEEFRGVTKPVNLELIRKRVSEGGLLSEWKEYVKATGELSVLAYREEVEAAMRTEGLSGISLLGIQDFPGQGTALVGMLNSHLKPKPFLFARPERFRSFFRECMLLVKLPRYTFEAGEELRAEVIVANFGKKVLEGEATWSLTIRDCAANGDIAGDRYSLSGSLGWAGCPVGRHTCIGLLVLPLDGWEGAIALSLTVNLGEYTNTYPIWVYPKICPACPESVYETRVWNKTCLEVLRQGGRVYLSPDGNKEGLPVSIKTQFTTDFWSVGTFAEQEGGMGQLIDVTHPIFRRFPTDRHTDWQWWRMATTRAVILPRRMKTIITEMDSYAFLRPMAQLIEFRCMGGTLLLSTMELHNHMQYPEVRALQAAIYEYLSGEELQADEELTEMELRYDLQLWRDEKEGIDVRL